MDNPVLFVHDAVGNNIGNFHKGLRVTATAPGAIVIGGQAPISDGSAAFTTLVLRGTINSTVVMYFFVEGYPHINVSATIFIEGCAIEQ